MTTKRILVIDDEAPITRNIKLSLEKTGAFIVHTENSAPQALAAAREFKPDLILLDIMMPDMDGGEVASQLASDALLKSIPIVYLTAIITKRETRAQNSPHLQGHFLAKPVGLEELVACIDGVLGEPTR